MKLDKKGSGEVTAADISLPAEVEVINPDGYICTLTKKGSIKAEMKVVYVAEIIFSILDPNLKLSLSRRT